ncbi:MAG TPA: low affinity iron permease family protein [Chitinophagaceae bacterium]|nr:low affinity iron permease family protein [Chitinophagaceae bacterium]
MKKKEKKEKKEKKGLAVLFNRFSQKVTRATGKPIAFILAFLIIIVWAVTGPVFHFSDTWQLVINTGTTIITFLMVFVIQQSQNRDTMAIQLKLNELIAVNVGASNRLVSIEDLTDAELETLKKYYTRLADLTKKEIDLFASHSIDEAQARHEDKIKNMGD